MGVTFGVDASKSGKNNHFLVIILVRLSQNIGLLDLKNRTRSKKLNSQKQRTKSVRDYWGVRLRLHTSSYYYTHKNVKLLEVCVLHSSELPRYLPRRSQEISVIAHKISVYRYWQNILHVCCMYTTLTFKHFVLKNGAGILIVTVSR